MPPPSLEVVPLELGEDAWDDRELIRAWDESMRLYKNMHGGKDWKDHVDSGAAAGGQERGLEEGEFADGGGGRGPKRSRGHGRPFGAGRFDDADPDEPETKRPKSEQNGSHAGSFTQFPPYLGNGHPVTPSPTLPVPPPPSSGDPVLQGMLQAYYYAGYYAGRHDGSKKE